MILYKLLLFENLDIAICKRDISKSIYISDLKLDQLIGDDNLIT